MQDKEYTGYENAIQQATNATLLSIGPFLGLDESQALARAKESVNTLMKVIKAKPKPLIINGKQYMEYADWQLLGLYFGITTKVNNIEVINEMYEKTDKDGNIISESKFMGYIVEVSALKYSQVISTTTAECTRHEKQWMNKDRNQIREMAQIRAKRSALKDVLRWVFSMASLDMPENTAQFEVDEDPESLNMFKEV